MNLDAQVLPTIRDFKAREGLFETADSRVIMAIHLMNAHGLDRAGALDQTSPGADDHGIDAWAFDDATATLHVFQSKLSESRAMVTNGLTDLESAADWLAEVLEAENYGAPLKNAAIYNLLRFLGQSRQKVRRIAFTLASPLSTKEVENTTHFDQVRAALGKSRLRQLLKANQADLDLACVQYVLERGALPVSTSYPVPMSGAVDLALPRKSQLQFRLVSLVGLVELLRRRGQLVFEKNVRLFLNTKENKARLEHPMEQTFDEICGGQLPPAMFAAYHGGVTISSWDAVQRDGNLLLDAPSIINGCQTVSIANRYLQRLERGGAEEKIRRFAQIQVLAKIVIRPTDDELRRIANCNNRQNPIEPWQLYCNDPVHTEIEWALKDFGVFYERQKGKFDADTSLRKLASYHRTNNTFIKVLDLAQLIVLCRMQLGHAAKPSGIFDSKEEHDAVFDGSVAGRVQEIVWAFNCYKAAKNGLSQYLDTPAHQTDVAEKIFRKPVIRQAAYYLCTLYMAQRTISETASFSDRLHKRAVPSLAERTAPLYRQVVSKLKTWYLSESDQLRVEVPIRKVLPQVRDIASQIGLDPDGPMALTNSPLDFDSLHLE